MPYEASHKRRFLLSLLERDMGLFLKRLLANYSPQARAWLNEHQHAQATQVEASGEYRGVTFRDPNTGEAMIVTSDRNGNPVAVDVVAQ